MIERAGLLVGLLLALVALYVGVQVWAAQRRRRRVNVMTEPGLSEGRRTVLFFTGEYCTVCHYRQRPAIEALQGEMNGTLRVVELDAARETALVKRFGVLSLPTTVILAADGTVGAVNYGFAPRDQLRAQVASVA
ncbi:MAG: hypothetical protein QOE92_37 [Chloroflexota bacterium]|jgi:thiol-disulfide isomerase/thioredoxin|nr:hypothetical protein [Chloroflexota bacterium]